MTDERTRPRPVTVAYWLWLACSALLVLFGLLAVTSSGAALRDQLLGNGAAPDDLDSLILLLRGSGAVALLVGLAVGLMAGPARAGDGRFRRALVALSAVFTFLELALLPTGVGQAPVLLVAVVTLAAGMLVYLPSATAWFDRG